MTATPPRPGRGVTRRDVARAAGVSDAVVSYTLNGGAPVAPATAARVREAVERLGYRPNQAARALRSGSARTFGLVVPDETNPFFAELGREVGTAAARHGFALYLTSAPADPEVTLQRFRDFAARQVDGVLLVPGATELDVDRLAAVGLPWALVDASVPRPGVASIGIDLRGGAYTATRHLIEDGRTRIGFLGDTGDHDERRAGWRQAVEEAGLVPGPAIPTGYDRAAGHAAVAALLESGSRPDAFFASSDLIAVGALLRCHESGVRIPEDLAVVSFDGSWGSGYTWPRLSTVRQPVELIAERAVAHLVDLAAGRSASAETTRLPGELLIRDSCGPHPDPAGPEPQEVPARVASTPR